MTNNKRTNLDRIANKKFCSRLKRHTFIGKQNN
ncbi:MULTISPECIES: hypothetical protein [Bacillaceae]